MSARPVLSRATPPGTWLGLALAITLALARPSRAQDDSTALAAELGLVHRQLALLHGRSPALPAALPGCDASDTPRWTAELLLRAARVGDRLAAHATERHAPAPDAARAKADLAAAELARAKGEDEPAMPPDRDGDAAVRAELEPTLGPLRDALSEAQRVRRELEAARASLTAQLERQRTLVLAIEPLLAGDEPKEPLARYRQGSIRHELAAARHRVLALERELDVAAAEAAQLDLATELARLRVDRAHRRLLALARRAWLALDVPALSQSRARADELARSLRERPTEAKASLPAGISDDQLPAWAAAYAARAAAVGALAEALHAQAQVPSEAALAELERGAQSRLDALRALPPLPAPDPLDAARLEELRERAQQLASRADSAQRVLDEHVALAAGSPARLEANAAALALARSELEGRPTGGSPLELFELDTAVVRERALAERAAELALAAARASAIERARALERDHARLELDRQNGQLARAAVSFEERQRARARAADEAARQAREAAALEQDPFERLRKLLRAERAAQDRAALEERALAAEQSLILELERPESERLAAERDRLADQLDGGRGLSERTVRYLLRLLERARVQRRRLAREKLPALAAALDLHRTAAAEVAERAWTLQRAVAYAPDDARAMLAADEDPALAEVLAAVVAGGRAAPAAEAYRQAAAELVPVLVARQGTLLRLLADALELERLYAQRAATLEALEDAVTARVYWIQNDLAFTPRVVAAVPDELARVWRVEAQAWSTSSATTSGASHPALAGAFIALLVLAIGLAWRLPAHPGVPRLALGLRSPLLARLLDGAVTAALPPACLYGAAALVARAGLPGVLAEPLRVGLAGAAWAWAGARAVRIHFAPKGYAEVMLALAPALSRELYAGGLLLSRIALVLGVPWAVSARAELELSHVPRLFETAFLLAYAVVVIWLLRPLGELCAWATGARAAPRRVWAVLWAGVGVALLGIAAMSLAGYRIGAAKFAGVSIQAGVAIALAAGCYALLMRLVQFQAHGYLARIKNEERTRAPATLPVAPPSEPAEPDPAESHTRRATRVALESVRRRRPKPSLAPAAPDRYAVLAELVPPVSRFAGILVIAVVALALASRFELLAFARTLGRGVVLPVGEGALDLWDIGCAVAWIAAGHLLLAYLPAVVRWVFYVRSPAPDTGAMYVAATLARYAVLLGAYGAALLALEFDPSSLGWLMAALSVGIGFGLSEIVANFVSGVILLLERPLRIGDIVTVGRTSGRVQQITIRATLVETADRQTHIVPNKTIVTGEVTNWTYRDKVVRWTLALSVVHGTDVTRLLEVLAGILDGHPDILDAPPHAVLFTGITPTGLDFALHFFAPIGEGGRVQSELYDLVNRRLAEEGIALAAYRLAVVTPP